MGVKIEVYGVKWAKEKIEKILKQKLNYKHISTIKVYLSDVPKECMKCQYFPCCEEEVCKVKR